MKFQEKASLGPQEQQTPSNTQMGCNQVNQLGGDTSQQRVREQLSLKRRQAELTAASSSACRKQPEQQRLVGQRGFAGQELSL